MEKEERGKKRTMKIKYILAFVLLFSVLTFGQAGCDFTGGGSQAQIIGLDFSLLPEAPPSTVEPDIEFQVITKIENYGKIATSGTFCAEDTIDDAYGGISRECRPFSIDAASEENERILPKSEIIYLPSPQSAFSYKGIESQPTSIIATLTYIYSTESSPMICVKDPLKQTAVSCETPEIKSVDVKAPLGISKIEKRILGVTGNQAKIRVDIHLKKQVDGTLLLPGAISGFTEGAENKVVLREVSFGLTLLNCETEGNIIEIATEKVLKCSGVVNVVGVIQHPLKIKLDYAVEVKKVYPLNIESS